MTEKIRSQIARAAAEAEAELEAQDADAEKAPAPVRARKQASDASQVYSVRIPVEQLGKLRKLADARQENPSSMLRRWVLERLEVELAGHGAEDLRSDVDSWLDKAVEKALLRKGLLDVTVSPTPGVNPLYLDPSGPVRLGESRLREPHFRAEAAL